MTDHHDAGLLPVVLTLFGGGFIVGLVVGVVTGLAL